MADSAASAAALEADTKSDTSLESVKAFDQTKVKAGAGALPSNQDDPLRHEDLHYFWADIERYFHPITTSDVSFLRNLPVNPYGGAHDDALRLHPNPTSDAAAASARVASRPPPVSAGPVDLTTMPNDRAALNSFPLTQRLVAALIDEGGGGQPSTALQRPARGSAGEVDTFWPGVGSETELRAFQTAMEARVATELKEVGLLPEAAIGDELTVALRHDQWKLRDAKTANRSRKSALYTMIAGAELRRQALKREFKKHMDMTEIAYLDRMSKKQKKNKKARNKYQKLRQKRYKYYKNQITTGISSSAGPSSSPPAGAASNSSGAASSGISSKVAGASLSLSAAGGSSGSSAMHSARSSSTALPILDDRPISKNKSVKKKKKKSEGIGSRPPSASKSAASKGKLHRFEDLED